MMAVFPRALRNFLLLSMLGVLALSLVLGPCSESSGQTGERAAPTGQGPHTRLDSRLLAVRNRMQFPTRVAIDHQDRAYVSDHRVGSVFLLDSALETRGELKGLAGPLGVAVDSGGRIYVGNRDRGNVEVYDRSGRPIGTLGAKRGEFSMPTDIAVSPVGTVFVVDSLKDCVKVFGPDRKRIRVIGGTGTGEGEFKFPSTIVISPNGSEIYVGDQGNDRIQVFDMQGGFLRSFGGEITRHEQEGRFARIQSIALRIEDGALQVHVLDSSLNRVQVLTPQGEFLEKYGETGRSPGELNLPLDIAVDSAGRVIACNSGNNRVEIIRR